VVLLRPGIMVDIQLLGLIIVRAIRSRLVHGTLTGHETGKWRFPLQRGSIGSIEKPIASTRITMQWHGFVTFSRDVVLGAPQ